MITNIFDQSSDIGFILAMYSLMIKQLTNSSDFCPSINALYLFVLSLTFFLFYRITSAIMVFIGTRNIWYSIGQFGFEYMLYRSIWVNYRLKCVQPSYPQKWLQNMESMLEAFPQLIIQIFYTIQIDELQGFVIVSVVFSLLSLINRAVREDKPLFIKNESNNWRDKQCSCKRFPCMNWRYLVRFFFRIFDVSNRVLMIVIVWHVFGGGILLMVATIEFAILLIIVAKTKEFSNSMLYITYIFVHMFYINNIINTNFEIYAYTILVQCP